jgi:hypothetical protein
VYLCNLPGEERFGLKSKDLPIMELTASKVIDSIRAEKTILAALEKIFPNSNQTTLNNLARKKFCPDECTIYPDVSSDDAADLCNFDARRPIPTTLSNLWVRVIRYIWKWKVLEIVFIFAILFTALAIVKGFRARSSVEHR